MTRRRIITFVISLAGAVLALLFFNGAYYYQSARLLFDVAVLAAAMAFIGRIRPARTVQREILRFISGILIHLGLGGLIAAYFVFSEFADIITLSPSLLLLIHIPIAISLAWSSWSIIRLGGREQWNNRRKAVLIYGAFMLTMLLVGAPTPIMVILAIGFVLFVSPWNWIESLRYRSGWIILLLFALAPIGFILFLSDLSTGESEGLTVAISTAGMDPLLQSRLLEFLGNIVAFTWFAIPLKLTVALFQGLFGVRIPIWLKFSTTYFFSTIIPGLLLLLLVFLGVYIGIGSLRAQLVRDMIHDDLRELELALEDNRLLGYAVADSVAAATYRRIFPSGEKDGQVPPPPNPFGSNESGRAADPYSDRDFSSSDSWRMYTRIDSIMGEMGPLEAWVKESDDSGLWTLPDTLNPFPGWNYASTERYGLLPLSDNRAAYAAATVPVDNQTLIKVAMRPLNPDALEPYKKTVRSEITLRPFEVIHMGNSDDGLSYQISDEKQVTDVVIRTARSSGNSIWEKYIAHGVTELESWPGMNNSSTSVGQIIVHTSIAGLFTTLYTWEGINRVTIIVLLVLVGLFGLVVLFSSLLAGGITRTIMRSVRELRQGTERLRKGDLEVQIEPRSNDELGDLAISFNEMTADLRRMISEVTIKERLEREIEIARRIQIHLLPTELPERPTLQVGAHSDPAFEVGGDYYDCIDLGEKGLLVVLGDVSGKGVGAAVLMSNLQASLSLLATQDLPLNEMVKQLNVQVCKNSTPEMFITFFAGLFDPEREILTYVNAGHDVPFLIRRGKPISLEIGGMLLGIMQDGEYTSAEIDIRAGDLFAAYSDGLTEAMNESDVEFGRDQLIQTMDEYKHLDPHSLVTKVLQTIRDYAGHERAGRDDLTLITVKVIES